MDRQNLTLLMDLHDLTMMQGYFKNKVRNKTVIFAAFYRRITWVFLTENSFPKSNYPKIGKRLPTQATR